MIKIPANPPSAGEPPNSFAVLTPTRMPKYVNKPEPITVKIMAVCDVSASQPAWITALVIPVIKPEATKAGISGIKNACDPPKKQFKRRRVFLGNLSFMFGCGLF